MDRDQQSWQQSTEVQAVIARQARASDQTSRSGARLPRVLCHGVSSGLPSCTQRVIVLSNPLCCSQTTPLHRQMRRHLLLAHTCCEHEALPSLCQTCRPRTTMAPLSLHVAFHSPPRLPGVRYDTTLDRPGQQARLSGGLPGCPGKSIRSLQAVHSAGEYR